MRFAKRIASRRFWLRAGHQPGLVHIFSAMERCAAYQPWHDKESGRTYVKPVSGKCLHYYFYFIDPELGLCYLRVPNLGALPPAGLLQRPQRLGGPVGASWDCL